MVGDDPIDSISLIHISAAETGDYIIGAVELCYWRKLSSVEELRHPFAVHLFTDSPVLPINHILDHVAVGHHDLRQVSGRI